jgi:hypothetical protein
VKVKIIGDNGLVRLGDVPLYEWCMSEGSGAVFKIFDKDDQTVSVILFSEAAGTCSRESFFVHKMVRVVDVEITIKVKSKAT